MSKQYFIKLSPIDRFFFGGDATFSLEGEKSEFESYIVESNYFPQQTSLLGMLRFLLLRKSSYFEDGHIKQECIESVRDLIGEASFSIQDERKYGVIEKLGPCMILKKGKTVPFAPFMDLSEKSFNVNADFYEGTQKMLPNFEYDHKKGYRKSLIDGTPIDIIFKEDMRLGISRDINSGEVVDDALYKQVFYRFSNSDYQFGFTVEINDDKVNVKLEDYNGEIVSLGGDNSQFRIEITTDIPSADSCLLGNNLVVLQSPAYLDKATVDLSCFFVAETIKFNYLQTSVRNTKCYHRTQDNGIKKEEHSIELYDSGSVFCFSSDEKKKSFLENLMGEDGNQITKNFYKIGYNQFVK